VFSLKSVAKHAEEFPDDIWIIVGSRVYDVTEFLPLHPAGAYSISKKNGKDCTTDYEFHSVAGRNLFKPYQIGVLETQSCIIS
jgi:cytochrome b involved in lipid metabolism